MATDTEPAVPTATTPAEPAAAPAPTEGTAASAKAPKAGTKKQKLSTEPHGYVADKLATFVRAVKTLTKKLRKDKEKAGGEAKSATETPAPSSAESAAAPAAKPEEPAPAAREGPGPIAGIMQQVHHHEPADKLKEPVSTGDKVKNAVVSTVEHVLDEAAAVKSSLSGAVAEEVEKLKHEAHEQQAHPHQGPVLTTAGGLPITEK